VTPTIAATPAEHQRFSEHLRHDAPAARTERRPDHEIGFTRCRARKQQQADVAADQESAAVGEKVNRVHDGLVAGAPGATIIA
jgi:hypothetical protein